MAGEQRGADGESIVPRRRSGNALFAGEVAPRRVGAEAGETKTLAVVPGDPGTERWKVLAPIEVAVGEVAQPVVGATGEEVEKRDAVGVVDHRFDGAEGGVAPFVGESGGQDEADAELVSGEAGEGDKEIERVRGVANLAEEINGRPGGVAPEEANAAFPKVGRNGKPLILNPAVRPRRSRQTAMFSLPRAVPRLHPLGEVRSSCAAQ